MSTLDRIVRITTLDQEQTLSSNDEVAVVDKSDTSGSVDGTDKRFLIRDFIESAPLRPKDNKGTQKPLDEWVGNFDTSIQDLNSKTQTATTSRRGISEFATDAEARNKSSNSRAISARNLAGLGSTETLAGLVALASVTEVSDGQADDKAVSPATLFDGLLGDATLGNDSWVFKLPTQNVVGGVKTELVIQFGQREFNTLENQLNPQSNFNHIHQTVQFDVTYPEPFPSIALMVIPMGFEATPSQYTEGTDFWIRPFEVRKSGATLKASRLNGQSDGSEIGVVRYLAIGY